ncbi:MAG TPA: dephospho-CoA kinase [Candidatus Hydrogenedentes bacterium]|nr:dephospho-CoA kinase [Candidatus Hydrogenedentota bacterium]HPG65487.1 dephospho-CoA kinase [Candidatus Hydrogenedentota bacterium]
MQLYGLTGGTGSGKSEAGKRFAERGIPVIDADKVGHELLEPGGGAEDAVLDAFGPAILANDAIDRTRLAEVVFRDGDALGRLNAIVHPALMRVVAERCASLAGEGHPAAIIDAALLAEGGARESWLNGLIVVVCPLAERIRRLVENIGISAEMAQRRIDAQTPPESKVPLADWVIENDGSLERLHEQVDAIVDAIRSVPSE